MGLCCSLGDRISQGNANKVFVDSDSQLVIRYLESEKRTLYLQKLQCPFATNREWATMMLHDNILSSTVSSFTTNIFMPHPGNVAADGSARFYKHFLNEILTTVNDTQQQRTGNPQKTGKQTDKRNQQTINPFMSVCNAVNVSHSGKLTMHLLHELPHLNIITRDDDSIIFEESVGMDAIINEQRDCKNAYIDSLNYYDNLKEHRENRADTIDGEQRPYSFTFNEDIQDSGNINNGKGTFKNGQVQHIQALYASLVQLILLSECNSTDHGSCAHYYITKGILSSRTVSDILHLANSFGHGCADEPATVAPLLAPFGFNSISPKPIRVVSGNVFFTPSNDHNEMGSLGSLNHRSNSEGSISFSKNVYKDASPVTLLEKKGGDIRSRGLHISRHPHQQSTAFDNSDDVPEGFPVNVASTASVGSVNYINSTASKGTTQAVGPSRTFSRIKRPFKMSSLKNSPTIVPSGRCMSPPMVSLPHIEPVLITGFSFTNVGNDVNKALPETLVQMIDNDVTFIPGEKMVVNPATTRRDAAHPDAAYLLQHLDRSSYMSKAVFKIFGRYNNCIFLITPNTAARLLNAHLTGPGSEIGKSSYCSQLQTPEPFLADCSAMFPGGEKLRVIKKTLINKLIDRLTKEWNYVMPTANNGWGDYIPNTYMELCGESPLQQQFGSTKATDDSSPNKNVLDLRESLFFQYCLSDLRLRLQRVFEVTSMVKKLILTKDQIRKILECKFKQLNDDIAEAPIINNCITNGAMNNMYVDDEADIIQVDVKQVMDLFLPNSSVISKRYNEAQQQGYATETQLSVSRSAYNNIMNVHHILNGVQTLFWTVKDDGGGGENGCVMCRSNSPMSPVLSNDNRSLHVKNAGQQTGVKSSHKGQQFFCTGESPQDYVRFSKVVSLSSATTTRTAGYTAVKTHLMRQKESEIKKRLRLVGDLESNERQKANKQMIRDRLHLLLIKEGVDSSLSSSDVEVDDTLEAQRARTPFFPDADTADKTPDVGVSEGQLEFNDSIVSPAPQRQYTQLPVIWNNKVTRRLTNVTATEDEKVPSETKLIDFAIHEPSSHRDETISNSKEKKGVERRLGNLISAESLVLKKSPHYCSPDDSLNLLRGSPNSHGMNRTVSLSNCRTVDILYYLNPLLFVWPLLHLHYLLWFPWLFGTSKDFMQAKNQNKDETKFADYGKNHFLHIIKYGIKVFTKDVSLEEYYLVMGESVSTSLQRTGSNRFAMRNTHSASPLAPTFCGTPKSLPNEPAPQESVGAATAAVNTGADKEESSQSLLNNKIVAQVKPFVRNSSLTSDCIFGNDYGTAINRINFYSNNIGKFRYRKAVAPVRKKRSQVSLNEAVESVNSIRFYNSSLGSSPMCSRPSRITHFESWWRQFPEPAVHAAVVNSELNIAALFSDDIKIAVSGSEKDEQQLQLLQNVFDAKDDSFQTRAAMSTVINNFKKCSNKNILLSINPTEANGLLFVSHQLACRNYVLDSDIRLVPEFLIVWSLDIVLDKNGKKVACPPAPQQDSSPLIKDLNVPFAAIDNNVGHAPKRHTSICNLQAGRNSNEVRFVDAKITVHRVSIKSYESYNEILQSQSSNVKGFCNPKKNSYIGSKGFLRSYSSNHIKKNTGSYGRSKWEARRQLFEELIYKTFDLNCEIVNELK